MKKCLQVFVALIFCFTTSCVSKPVREYKTLNLEDVDASALPEKAINTIVYSELIYNSSKLPLEDFFNGVMTGQFISALRNLDILYHPSNTDNEVLLELLSHGIVPVFVSIQNKGTTAAEVNLANFVLSDNGINHAPLTKAEIPDRITRFSTANAAKNVINVGAVVVLMAAILAAAVAARANLPGNIDPQGNYSAGGSNTELYELKGTTIITKVEYGSLILENRVLQPGESAKGLLFFQTRNQKPPARPKLLLQP